MTDDNFAPKTVSNNLPSNEKIFEIDVVGDTTKQRFTGRFKCFCVLSMRQFSLINVFERKLASDLMTLSADIQLYHQSIANLRYRLIEAPSWWNESNYGQDLKDFNVILDIVAQCVKAEQEWKDVVNEQNGKPTSEVSDGPVIKNSD